MNESRYRQAEQRLWQSVGVTPEEQRLHLRHSDVSIRVQLAGEGPPIVLVHGGAISGSSWAALVAALPHFRCIVVDRPGCGLSEPLRKPFDNVQHFRTFSETFVTDVLDAMDIDAANVIGTSYGGFITVHGTAAHPERVLRLVELGSCFGSPMEHIPLVMRIGSIPALANLSAKMPPSRFAAKAIMRQIGLKDAMAQGRVSEEMIDWFLANMRDTDSIANEIIAGPRLINMGGMVDDAIISADLLGSITTPVKLIWGDNDPMAGAHVARKFAAQIPGAQLDLWAGAGHAPWLDYPDRAATSITEFFQDL